MTWRPRHLSKQGTFRCPLAKFHLSRCYARSLLQHSLPAARGLAKVARVQSTQLTPIDCRAS